MAMASALTLRARLALYRIVICGMKGSNRAQSHKQVILPDVAS